MSAKTAWIAGLVLLTLGLVAAEPVAADSPDDCVPEPESAKPNDIVEWAAYVLFFWDPNLANCPGA